MLRRSLVLWLCLMCLGLQAEVRPSALFGHHAVLHRSGRTPIFGVAAPGERVCVSLAGQRRETVAGEDGRWLVRLDLTVVGEGPYELKVNDQVYRDILIGEVWLCSGQSNMEFRLHSCEGAKEEIAASANERLRCFTAPSPISETPRREMRGSWAVASPKTSGGFTGVGYYFGKCLQQALKRPVGLVHASRGASSVEAWFPKEAFGQSPELERIIRPQYEFYATYPELAKRYQETLTAWETKYERLDPQPDAAIPEQGWSKADAKRTTYPAGALWFKRTVKLTPQQQGRTVSLTLRRFLARNYYLSNNAFAVYWNGQRLQPQFSTSVNEPNAVFFTVPAEQCREVENTLAIRQFNSRWGDAMFMQFRLNGRQLGANDWWTVTESTLPPLSQEARAAMPARQPHCFETKYPSGLYNEMIHPMLPLGLSGIIWYQGESNAAKASDYEISFPAFIQTWRRLFQQEALPFLWCQLANYMGKTKNAGAESSWAQLREAQTRTRDKVAHTGQAILIDCGEAHDIHPRDKKTPGERLAALALSQVYGRNVPCLGPRALKAERQGDAVRVHFVHADGTLVAAKLGDTYPGNTREGKYPKLERNTPDSELEGFAVQGADGVWHWAKATIDGETVVLRAEKVPAPVTVRYAWGNNPTVNLYNRHGLPAEPFSMSVK